MFMTLVYAIILLVNGFSHVPKTHLLKEYRPSKSLKNYTRKRQFFLLIGHQNVSQWQNTFFSKHMIRLKCSWEWSKACPSRHINPFPPRLSCGHVLIFVSRDEILWCYQSDESSLAELLPSTIYILGIYRNKSWIFCSFHLWPLSGMEGLTKDT